MSKNRVIPYGYKFVDGKFCIEEQESEILQSIIDDYLTGSSYKTIAERLTSENVEYTTDKSLWNKNMIARILKNEVYKGTEKYPQIIDEERYNQIQSAMKPYVINQNKEVTKIRKLLYCFCGNRLEKRRKHSGEERWYCEEDRLHISQKLNGDIIMEQFHEILNQSFNQNTLYSSMQDDEVATIELVKLENETSRAINSGEITNKEEIEQKVIEIAQLKYEKIISNDTEKEFVETRIKQYLQDKELTPIVEILERVIIENENITKIQFKNGICCNFKIE